MALKRNLLIALSVATAVMLIGQAAAQSPGATSTEVKIGNTAPYSGLLSTFGTIGKAMAAYFKKVNDEGGVNGRKINFVSYDDAYAPAKTAELVRKLVESDAVAFITGPFGTPSNIAIREYMNRQKIPHLFAVSSSPRWNDPNNFPWSMGWQPNFHSEGFIYARHVLKNVSNPKIGVLWSNDEYGNDLVTGFKVGLGENAGKLIVLEQGYGVQDGSVESQVIKLKGSGANVFLNVSTGRFAVEAVKKAQELSEIHVILYSFALTLINLAVVLSVVGLWRRIRARRRGSVADSFVEGGFLALTIPVALAVGLIVGVAAEKDVFFRAARWFAWLGLVNRESSKRPLAYVLYRNDRSDFKRDPVLDGRLFEEARPHAWVRVRLEGQVIEGWPRYYDLKGKPSELLLSPACEIQEDAAGAVRTRPINGAGVVVYEEKIATILLVDETSACADYWLTPPKDRKAAVTRP